MDGFWSLSIHNDTIVPSKESINCLSVGTKNIDLELAADGRTPFRTRRRSDRSGVARQLASRPQGRLIALRPRLSAKAGDRGRRLWCKNESTVPKRNVSLWQRAPKGRVISGERFHSESCQWMRKLTSGLAG